MVRILWINGQNHFFRSQYSAIVSLNLMSKLANSLLSLAAQDYYYKGVLGHIFLFGLSVAAALSLFPLR